MTVGVSRETLADRPRRKYHSGYRNRRGEETRRRLVDAVLASIGEGRFRPTADDIAERAGCAKALIFDHFGALKLLNHVVAREHADRVLEAIGIEPLDSDAADAYKRNLVWIVMTGKRRPRP